jgi:hypothetical protein
MALRQIRSEIEEGTRRISVPITIPEYTRNPAVRRTVRLRVILNNTTGTFTITPSVISAQDEAGYGSSSVRYVTMIPFSVKAWIEDNPSATLTSAAYGIVLTDTGTNFTVTGIRSADRTPARAGLRLNRNSRVTPVATTSTTSFVQVATDQTIPTGTDIFITCDCFVEFA